MNQRSRLRDRSGPRVVESGHQSQRYREGNENESSGLNRNDSTRPSRRGSTLRRSISSHGPQPTDLALADSSLELEVLVDPAKSIHLGTSVQTCIMVYLRLPTSDRVISANNINTSQLLGVTSLVADNRNGERIPLEPGLLSGQKMYDSVQPFPDRYGSLPYNDPCRQILGCFTFPDLLIRQAGNYRIRTTLVQMDGSSERGATSLFCVDSDSIRVDRRSNATQRRHQRVYN